MNEKIERLIQLNPAYEGTPLAAWARENESEFLRKLSDLRQDFPNKLIIATDYLFSASSYTYQEILQKISLDQIQRKKIDRRGSMQGGFPWTDDSHPWPFFDDGKPVRPSIQLNLQAVGRALGLPLPEVIYQFWGGYDGGPFRVIDLADIEDKEPDWCYPDFSAGSDLVWPDDGGWVFEHEKKSGEIEWVGNTIEVGEKAFEMPCMDIFFKDEDPDYPEPWRDVSLWLKANDLDQAEFILARLADSTSIEADYISQRDECYSKFEHTIKKSRRGPSGRFLDNYCYLPGDIKYHELVLRGVSCLYNPGALKEKNPLQFDDARTIIVAKLLYSSLPPKYDWEKIEVGFLYSQYNRELREQLTG